MKDIRIVKKPKQASEEDLQRQALQRLANNVTNEEHWQTILASAPSEENRDEIERVVGPLLTFRRAAPCTTPDCQSGLPSLWQPVLVVASSLTPDELSWVTIELRLCDECKQEARLGHFLTDSVWTQIIAAWDSETPPPVRRLTTLSWDRIH